MTVQVSAAHWTVAEYAEWRRRQERCLEIRLSAFPFEAKIEQGPFYSTYILFFNMARINVIIN
jgi:hypothetical protein